MKCPKCGNELQEVKNREGYYLCDRCNLYFKLRSKSANTSSNNSGMGYSYVKDPQPTPNTSGATRSSSGASPQEGPKKICCPVCGGTNVDISFVQYRNKKSGSPH